MNWSARLPARLLLSLAPSPLHSTWSRVDSGRFVRADSRSGCVSSTVSVASSGMDATDPNDHTGTLCTQIWSSRWTTSQERWPRLRRQSVTPASTCRQPHSLARRTCRVAHLGASRRGSQARARHLEPGYHPRNGAWWSWRWRTAPASSPTSPTRLPRRASTRSRLYRHPQQGGPRLCRPRRPRSRTRALIRWRAGPVCQADSRNDVSFRDPCVRWWSGDRAVA